MRRVQKIARVAPRYAREIIQGAAHCLEKCFENRCVFCAGFWDAGLSQVRSSTNILELIDALKLGSSLRDDAV